MRPTAAAAAGRHTRVPRPPSLPPPRAPIRSPPPPLARAAPQRVCLPRPYAAAWIQPAHACARWRGASAPAARPGHCDRAITRGRYRRNRAVLVDVRLSRRPLPLYFRLERLLAGLLAQLLRRLVPAAFHRRRWAIDLRIAPTARACVAFPESSSRHGALWRRDGGKAIGRLFQQIARLWSRSPPCYMASLPRLPLPTLQETCQRYLESLRPLLSEGELRTSTTHVVRWIRPAPTRHPRPTRRDSACIPTRRISSGLVARESGFSASWSNARLQATAPPRTRTVPGWRTFGTALHTSTTPRCGASRPFPFG